MVSCERKRVVAREMVRWWWWFGGEGANDWCTVLASVVVKGATGGEGEDRTCSDDRKDWW